MSSSKDSKKHNLSLILIFNYRKKYINSKMVAKIQDGSRQFLNNSLSACFRRHVNAGQLRIVYELRLNAAYYVDCRLNEEMHY